MSDQVDQTINESATGTTSVTTPAAGIFTPPTQPAPPAATPQTPPPAQDATTGKDDLPEWAQKELEKARQESADRRVKLRETEAQLKELQPLAEKFKQQEEAAKTEEEKLREKLATLEASQEKAKAEVEQARRESTLIRLAAKAGVDPDVASLLDINKLDLDDETAVLETLKKLSTVRVSGGGPSNPAGQEPGPTDADLRQQYFGSGLSQPNLIFGGNK